EEQVGTARPGGPRSPRHRKDLSALLEGMPGGHERSAPVARFDDHDPEREPADDPVPPREVLPEGRRPGRQLTDDAGPRQDLLPEPRVPPRVDDVRPAADDGDRVPVRIEGAAMGGRVDAAREAA